MLKSAFTAASVAVALLVAAPSAAACGEDGAYLDPNLGGIGTIADDCVTETGSDAEPADRPAGSSAPPARPDSPFGWWSEVHQCYMQRADAPVVFPIVGEGSVYNCTVEGLGPSGYIHMTRQVFVPAGEEPVPPVDAVTVALQAQELLPLPVAEVQTAPGGPHISYVNLETWLWVPAEQWVPLTQSATAGSTTVTATATPVRVEWDMGEDTTSCHGPGRAWLTSYDDYEETTCSYTYASTSADQPDLAYPISAAIVYEVSWTCSGSCSQLSGSIGEVTAPAGTASLQVGTRQTVIVRGD